MNAVETVETFLRAYWARDHDMTLSLVTEDFAWPNVALPKTSIDSRLAMREVLVNQNIGFSGADESGHHETVNADRRQRPCPA